MAARRKIRARDAQLAFEALSIEGGLLSPDWLSKVAQLQGGQQSESEYRIPKGLNLRDEMGRYWRIAQAHWADFAGGRKSNADPKLLASRFVTSFLREAFGFTSLIDTAPLVIAERSYPIGHSALNGRVPVVIAPADAGLDTLAPAFGEGGRRRSAFGLAQEFLNAHEGALWGVATDGGTLRIVRDNASLTRPAWIEADLRRIFAEERYADFAALWLLLHETRFGRDGQAVTECPLENWRNAGREEGTRARDYLRRGVEEALIALGQGFLSHPGNATLRAELQSGALTTKDYFNQLLRLVYRLIFLLTVEERGLLHPPETVDAIKALYAEGYGLRRLRERSLKRSAHDRFADLWEATKIIFRGVAAGEPRLGLSALAGIFAASQCPALDAAALENRWLLLAVFRLAWLRDDGALARVNWRDMGPEELGSVYESLLELVPQITENGRQFAFATGGETKGNARKTTGSYYTPDSLVQVLLDSALEPVIAETIARNPSDPIEALLALSIVDPACGSGHFLLAAARRLAAHVARLQANGTPSAAEYRHALRQVVGRCMYGVDLNPMAVELCKVSLWMEAVEPGLPLTFLDAHVQHGNALLGTTPELIAHGIPDKAWEPIEGDDRKVASALKKRNKNERTGQRTLQFGSSLRSEEERAAVMQAVAALEAASDASREALAKKESQWDAILSSPEYCHQKIVADAWCSAFVWLKQPGDLDHAAPTHELWRQIRDGEGQPPALTAKTVQELAEQYAFFHWHLQFPQVFANGGFDVVLGNPPWDEIQFEETAWFSSRDSKIASAPTAAARGDLIARLSESSAALQAEYRIAVRLTEATRHFLQSSGSYRLGATGQLNTATLFTVRATTLYNQRTGRFGSIVPTGIATDKRASEVFGNLMQTGRLRSLLDFVNRRLLFPDVRPHQHFCLLTAGAPQPESARRTDFAAFLEEPSALLDADRHYHLSWNEICALNPESKTLSLFASVAEAEVSAKLTRRLSQFSAHIHDGDWHPHFQQGTFHMAGASRLFRTAASLAVNGYLVEPLLATRRREPAYVPLFDGKMARQFEWRAASLGFSDNQFRKISATLSTRDELRDPSFVPAFAYWVPQHEADSRIRSGHSLWLLGLKDVTGVTSTRLAAFTFVPRLGVAHSFSLLAVSGGATEHAFLCAWMNSLLVEWFLRQRMQGLHLTWHLLGQVPVPNARSMRVPVPWDRNTTVVDWVSSRVAELSCTSWAMDALAQDLVGHSCVYEYHDERRALLRLELDAAVFMLAGFSSSDALFVMESLDKVATREMSDFGVYRSRSEIPVLMDAMAEATRTGQPYQTRLDPPPADLRVAHPQRGATVVSLVASSIPSVPFHLNRYRELPTWTLGLLPAVAERTGLDLDGSWATNFSGYDLGFTALAAVLRNLPGPSSREDIERAVVLVLLPRLMQSKFEAKMVGMWRRLIGADMALTSIASLSIPWNQILRLAVNQRILEIVEGRWSPGPEVQDAPSPALDARAIVSLSWLVNAGAEDQELNAQLGVLNVA